MKSRFWLSGTAGVAAIGAAGILASQTALPAQANAAAAAPVVVELYQSQGCSSCPPADANLNAIADQRDVIALSFAVTYWDQLGWKDTFAKPVFTARQWDYARSAGRSSVATPQIVIDGGRKTIVGNDRRQLDAAIASARRDVGPRITANGDRVSIGAAPAEHSSTVWLVRYDPRVNNVPIRAGENNGRTLPHRNIVRELDAIGTWSGKASAYTLPVNPNPVYRTAILVQTGKGGPIVAAARL